ncbi:conserved membrane hypothetical protein [Tenacibaculum maritimum]|uniref:hypothetical protein n=1 Tax=Tenacibaculum maritimum TaxID=107401 RepID=UPI0012E6E17C|nr:hypothetical protein [Tenacibaculum maritimum]CAA0191738.1 conserved membrane hypothetical protein [Tenacibaculum maritimum]
MLNNYTKNYNELFDQIRSRIGKPVSINVVVAIIESFGLKDKNIPVEYDFKDIRELATKIFKELRSDLYKDLKNQEEIRKDSNVKKEKEGFLHEVILFVKSYLSNTSSLLTLVIQLATIIIFGLSLYAFVGFNQLQSTAVILGIILGMVLSGGIIQVVGSEVSKHYYLKDFEMVRRMTFFLIKQGVLFLATCLSIIIIFNLLVPIYPFSMVFFTSIYAFLIGVLFLVFAPLHVLKSRIVIFISITFPTLLGIYLAKRQHVSIYQIHFIGLLLAITMVLSFIFFYFKSKKIQKTKRKRYTKGALFYNNIYFFLYGSLINLFFFIDRIVAWSNYKTSNFFFPVLYEKDYEIGMDISIIFFFLLAGSIEYSNTFFITKLNKTRHHTKFIDIKSYQKSIYKIYLRNIGLLILTSIPFYIFVQYIIYGEWGYNHYFAEPIEAINIKIAQISTIAYFFVCWGILNTSYLTFLKKQRTVVKILFIACITNIISGFFLSRFFYYEDSVYGLLIGAILFAGLTFKENINILKNIDYYTSY